MNLFCLDKLYRPVLFVILNLFSTVTSAQEPKTTVRPNIIIFLVDDMGWQDCSVPFWDTVTRWNKLYETPSMERLASEGMKFTNAYATPVCTPTRVSLVTGMNAAHHRVTNWTSPLPNTNTDNSDTILKSVNWNLNGLSPVPGLPNTVYATTLPQLLQEAGYITMHVGKAHFASTKTPGSNPLNLGFDINIAGGALGHPASYLGEKDFGFIPGKRNLNAVPGLEKYHGKEIFLSEALTREAIEAMRSAVKMQKPFFLNMAHYAVHLPYDTDSRFFQKYLDKGLDPNEAKYAALIEGMDKSLGDIMDYLKDNDLDKNTIILFISDNGGFGLAPPRSGRPQTQNSPLRAGKGSVYEGGIRVPMIVKWPCIAAAGSTTDQPVIIEDFFPTILEMAAVNKYQTVQKTDGESFVPVLKKSTANNNRVLVWHYPNKWINDESEAISWQSAARQGNWKLIYGHKTGKLELYNLENDIGERNNVAKLFPDITIKLAALLSARMKAYNALMPVFKTTAFQVPYPDAIRY